MPNVEREIAELQAAGWEKVLRSVWKSPSGALFVGPHGAYEHMKKYPSLSVKREAKLAEFKPEVDMPIA